MVNFSGASSQSETFNETTGDFALSSSDNTVFYVPRAVLQLSSKVFETMFKAGTESPEDASPIRMQATANELDIILKVAHPGHKKSTVHDVHTLLGLLCIAKRYEMDAVLDDLREWLVKTRYVDGETILPIAVREPLASLVVAHSFGFRDEVRFALREVVKCDLSVELDKAQKCDIPLSLMHFLHGLRAERIAWYTGRVMELSEALIASYLGAGSLFGGHTMLSRSPSHQVSCEAIQRLASCLRWQHKAMKELERHPTFCTFEKLVCEGDGQAVFIQSTIKDEVEQFMETWRAEATKFESEFPQLDVTSHSREWTCNESLTNLNNPSRVNKQITYLPFCSCYNYGNGNSSTLSCFETTSYYVTGRGLVVTNYATPKS